MENKEIRKEVDIGVSGGVDTSPEPKGVMGSMETETKELHAFGVERFFTKQGLDPYNASINTIHISLFFIPSFTIFISKLPPI